MSLRELETIITKLEQTKGKKGGACKCTKGGRSKKKSGGELLQTEQGGILSGGEIVGMDGSGLTGGEILDISGSGLEGGKGKRGRKKKCGGEIQQFDGGIVSGGMTTGAGVPKQLQGWLAHVKQVRAKHPNTPYKEILQLAKQSYK